VCVEKLSCKIKFKKRRKRFFEIDYTTAFSFRYIAFYFTVLHFILLLSILFFFFSVFIN
jgi:hypothetical protein